MKIGIAVECTVCGQQKQPHGRSASMMMTYCDTNCPGYEQDPKPGCLWPGESDQDFGYQTCDNATRELAICECGHPHSEHHEKFSVGLECFACAICGCPEYSGPTPANNTGGAT